MFKSFFQFLISKMFAKNIVIYILLITLMLGGVIYGLNSFTRHGESIKVPDFSGVPVDKLKEFSLRNNLSYLIVDSMYYADVKPGIVIKQDPESEYLVKEGREIYLYISATSPPNVVIPKLIDCSLRQALSKIISYGFTVGEIKFVTEECINCVVDVMVNGKKIYPNQTISKGTSIDLVVGKGERESTVGIPCLYGLNRNEAIIRLASSTLSIGKVVVEGSEKDLLAKVYRQIPDCDENAGLGIGSTIDLFLTTNEDKIPELPVDSLEIK